MWKKKICEEKNVKKFVMVKNVVMFFIWKQNYVKEKKISNEKVFWRQ